MQQYNGSDLGGCPAPSRSGNSALRSDLEPPNANWRTRKLRTTRIIDVLAAVRAAEQG